MVKKTTIALIYDFDGTLSPGNMQEFGFIQAIGKDSKSFWEQNKKLSEENDASGILCYMYLMLQKAQAENISLSRSSFRKFGRDVELFKGVQDWFKLINDYGKSVGVNIEHYINSSGLTEMIEGTSIAKEFKKIYACSFCMMSMARLFGQPLQSITPQKHNSYSKSIKVLRGSVIIRG